MSEEKQSKENQERKDKQKEEVDNTKVLSYN